MAEAQTIDSDPSDSNPAWLAHYGVTIAKGLVDSLNVLGAIGMITPVG